MAGACFRARLAGSRAGRGTHRPGPRRLPADRLRLDRGRGPPRGFGAADLAAVLATCHRPRRHGRGVESGQVALERGRLDAVIAGFLFMAGMRRSEVNALRWADVADAADGDGVLVTVRRSKTNQEGETRDVRFVKDGCRPRPPDPAGRREPGAGRPCRAALAADGGAAVCAGGPGRWRRGAGDRPLGTGGAGVGAHRSLPLPEHPPSVLPGRSAGSTLGSTAAASRMRPSPLTSPNTTTRGEPRLGASTAVAAVCFRARLAREPSPAGGTHPLGPRWLPADRQRPRPRTGSGAADLAAERRHLPPAAGLLFMAGMRRSEVSALRWADVADAADGDGTGAGRPSRAALAADGGAAVCGGGLGRWRRAAGDCPLGTGGAGVGAHEPGRVDHRRDARRELEDEPDGLLGRPDRRAAACGAVSLSKVVGTRGAQSSLTAPRDVEQGKATLEHVPPKAFGVDSIAMCRPGVTIDPGGAADAPARRTVNRG